MEIGQLFNQLFFFLTYLITVVLVLVSIAIGFRLGRRTPKNKKSEKNLSIGTVVGTMLALLAFTLAFTFSMTSSRFDARKQLVLNEANTIRTAILRTDFLTESPRIESRKLFKEYVDLDQSSRSIFLDVSQQPLIELQQKLNSSVK